MFLPLHLIFPSVLAFMQIYVVFSLLSGLFKLCFRHFHTIGIRKCHSNMPKSINTCTCLDNMITHTYNLYTQPVYSVLLFNIRLQSFQLLFHVTIQFQLGIERYVTNTKVFGDKQFHLFIFSSVPCWNINLLLSIEKQRKVTRYSNFFFWFQLKLLLHPNFENESLFLRI